MKTDRVALVACLLAAGAGAHAGSVQLLGTGMGSYEVPVTSLQEARFKATLHQRYDYSCGSAAVATLLSYHYGYVVTEQSVFEDMYAVGKQDVIRSQGFSMLDIKGYLERHGFAADAFALPLSKLAESGLPALVLVNEKGYYHFVVVKGLQEGRVLIGDPSSGTRAITQEAFNAIWANKLLFVIHNKQEQAHFNSLVEWQIAPRAPIAQGVATNSWSAVQPWPKLGPGDY